MISTLISTLGQQAKIAARQLSQATTQQKNNALLAIANSIEAQRLQIQQENERDLQAAEAQGLASALIDRLQLNDARFNSLVDGIRQIVLLPDPVGDISRLHTTPKGLQIGRMRVPLGVIGIIYESRPNVTADAAALCLKSGNAAILRGGSEALHSNLAIMRAITAGLEQSDLPSASIQLLGDSDRRHIHDLLAAAEYIDVLIPRGGRALVELVSDKARMPVIKHLDGLCHLYIDASADLNKAVHIADNGKTYRYGICGATETLLVHREIAPAFLPAIAAIYRKKGVEMRGCVQTQAILTAYPEVVAATESDWQSEYLAPIIAIKVVENYQAAVAHINTYSSAHTDAIVCEHLGTAQRFLREIDSASVMVNTPTCFADGYEYGLGAEIGISTDKIHWRGPVGLEGLTSEKFIVLSDGVLR